MNRKSRLINYEDQANTSEINKLFSGNCSDGDLVRSWFVCAVFTQTHLNVINICVTKNEAVNTAVFIMLYEWMSFVKPIHSLLHKLHTAAGDWWLMMKIEGTWWKKKTHSQTDRLSVDACYCDDAFNQSIHEQEIRRHMWGEEGAELESCSKLNYCNYSSKHSDRM